MIKIQDMDSRIAKILGYIELSLELSPKEKEKLLERVWSFASKVRQPRKDDRSCNKTPYFDRWDVNTKTSYLTNIDARHAPKQECELVILKLLVLLLEVADAKIEKIGETIDAELIKSMLGREMRLANLKCIVTNQKITKDDIKKSIQYATQRLGSFDIPIGYVKELSDGGKHNHDNVGWIKPFHINYKLRDILKKEIIAAGGKPKSVKSVLDKIQVKAYCTDKFTMPPYFSNRDVRWATWPESNQYASHYECYMIELELMTEIFEFVHAPNLDEQIKIEIQEKRGKELAQNSRKCYITGRDLSFKTYLEGATSPKGGKSLYHVSHPNPLTRGWET